jgi:hypothetical protein
MLFESPHANLQVICSRTLVKYHPVTGDEIERTPAIWANFGKLGEQYEFMNPETHEMTGAAITGHFYDTDVEASQNGWDADTKAMVERKLLAYCQREPSRCKHIEREAVSAAPPWPTYDQADAKQAVALATQLGLVAESLAYERENKDRPAVVEALEALVDEQPDETPAPDSGPKIDPAKLAELSRTITV